MRACLEKILCTKSSFHPQSTLRVPFRTRFDLVRLFLSFSRTSDPFVPLPLLPEEVCRTTRPRLGCILGPPAASSRFLLYARSYSSPVLFFPNAPGPLAGNTSEARRSVSQRQPASVPYTHDHTIRLRKAPTPTRFLARICASFRPSTSTANRCLRRPAGFVQSRAFPPLPLSHFLTRAINLTSCEKSPSVFGRRSPHPVVRPTTPSLCSSLI